VHFPSYVRKSFVDWIEDGFPEAGTVDVRGEPRDVSADQMLRLFLVPVECTDIMPAAASERIAHRLEYTEGLAPLTYGLAATALLIERTSGRVNAKLFLDRLLADERAGVSIWD
jgi:hypothetical protein